MTTAYFDCFAGAGGDMIVGALIDAGCDFDALRGALSRLPLGNVELSAETVHRAGLAGIKFHVGLEHADHEHRHLADILGMIDSANLPNRAAERARRVFRRLAEAEAKVHHVDVEAVHFHEVGAVDSIIDVVGACLALELLGVDRVLCSAIPVGHGSIDSAHGRLPLPAPATAALLAGARTVQLDLEAEATTPTAAALLTTLGDSYGALPEMDVSAVGFGAGTRENGPLPNLLRVFLGKESSGGQADSLIELAANIDDATGEMIGAAIDRLLAAGCADAWATPVAMKKSRPAWMLCALAAPCDAAEAERIIFSETTTFGVRRRTVSRTKLDRSFETVETEFGPIRVKIGRLRGQTVTMSPEFEDCRLAAEAHHAAVKDALAAASAAYRKRDA